MKKLRKFIAMFLSVLAISIFVLILPTLKLKTSTMKVRESEHFTFYYEEKDTKAIEDIENALESMYEKINKAMNFTKDKKSEIYIYGDLETLHKKKYGYIGAMVGPDWYIGDNIKDKIIIVSPLNPGPSHSYESVVQAAVHEYVHTVVYQINSKTPKFLNEGLAGYLSGNTKPNYKINLIPTFEDTKISNPIKFGNSGMYGASYTYIHFLEEQYGMSKVLELVRTPKEYEKIFGVSEDDIYNNWIEFIEREYAQ